VLFHRGQVEYTDGAPTDELMAQMKQRNDKQIMTLVSASAMGCAMVDWQGCVARRGRQEILAIMVALSTFASELSGRKVILYSDNVGAEKSTAKGSANAFDHNRLVHEIWTLALLHRQSLA